MRIPFRSAPRPAPQGVTWREALATARQAYREARTGADKTLGTRAQVNTHGLARTAAIRSGDTAGAARAEALARAAQRGRKVFEDQQTKARTARADQRRARIEARLGQFRLRAGTVRARRLAAKRVQLEQAKTRAAAQGVNFRFRERAARLDQAIAAARTGAGVLGAKAAGGSGSGRSG